MTGPSFPDPNPLPSPEPAIPPVKEPPDDPHSPRSPVIEPDDPAEPNRIYNSSWCPTGFLALHQFSVAGSQVSVTSALREVACFGATSNSGAFAAHSDFTESAVADGVSCMVSDLVETA